jgi:hypothetical protein
MSATPEVSADIARLRDRLFKHSYKLPDGYYNDEDYGCNEDGPLSLIMAILDHGPRGIEVMETLTAYEFTVVETAALHNAANELERLVLRIATIEDALEKCRNKFAKYVEQHRAKLTDDVVLNEREAIWSKIERNQAMVELCDTALAQFRASEHGGER